MKSKKLLAFLLAVMMLAACLTGCSSSSQTTTESAAPAETAPAAEAAPAAATETFVFKHGFDLDYPPYSYLSDDGSVGGFDVELAQALCDYLGWGYEAHPFNWDAKDAELQSGACDCIWSGFTVEGRENDYTWSIAYSKNTQGILVASDSGITSLADLTGKVVGVQTATSAYDMLMDEDGVPSELCATFADLRVFETYTIAFNDLQAGGIDAIAIDMTAGAFLISGADGYQFLDESLGEESYAIGFRVEDTALRDQVNDALNALVENGTYDAIGQKYPDIYDYLCLGK